MPRNWLRFGARLGSATTRGGGTPSERDPFDRTVKVLVEVTKARNWIDFVRGALGAFVVFYVADEQAEAAGPMEPWRLTAIGVVVLGILAQMLRLEGRLALFAPIFFLQGVAVGVLGPVTGLIAMVGVWAFSPLLPNPAAVLLAQGAGVLALGIVLGADTPPTVVVVAALMWLPSLVGLLMRRRLAASFDKRVKIVSRENRERAAAAS